MYWEPESCGEVEVNEGYFPGCCSIGVLYGASYPDKASFLRAMKESLAAGNLDHDSAGLLLYSLDETQKTEREVLLEVGFIELTSYHSPRSQKRVTLYGLHRNQPKPKPAKAAKAKRRR